MNKINELNSIFICSDCNYKNVDLPFLNRIYRQFRICDCGENILFNLYYSLYDLYSINDKDKRFLFL